MSLTTLILALLIATTMSYFIGRSRAATVAKPIGGIKNLETLPSYYATMMSLWALIPALLLIFIWLIFDGSVITALVMSELPDEAKQLDGNAIGLLFNQITNVAEGIGSIDLLGNEYVPAVERLRELNATCTGGIELT